MNIRKCKKCGAIVEVIKDCTCNNCGIMCCGETMQEDVFDSELYSLEKHQPTYKRLGEYIVVTVNHPSEENHYISHLGLSSERISARKSFKPGEKFEAVFPYIKGSTIYSICTTHGICKTIVD